MPNPNLPSPAIQFQVDLTLRATEQVGADAYPVNSAAVNGDVFPSDPTLAAIVNAVRQYNLVTWLPGLNGAGGREARHGDTFWAYGQEAIYLKYTYGIGVTPPAGSGFNAIPADRQYLTVVSEI